MSAKVNLSDDQFSIKNLKIQLAYTLTENEHLRTKNQNLEKTQREFNAKFETIIGKIQHGYAARSSDASESDS